MESLLNAVWALFAAGLILAHLRQPSRARLLAPVFALVCMAVLLFPVISITDDLHAQQELSDDCPYRKALRSIDQTGTATAPIALFGSPLLFTAPALRPTFWAMLPNLRTVDPEEAHLRAFGARAPPFSSL